jgi:hypothetical protein
MSNTKVSESMIKLLKKIRNESFTDLSPKFLKLAIGNGLAMSAVYGDRYMLTQKGNNIVNERILSDNAKWLALNPDWKI